MSTPRRILVPTDFSRASARALQHGLALAHRQDAELHVLHVVTGRADGPWAYVGFPEMEEMQQRMEASLAALGCTLPSGRLRKAIVRAEKTASAIAAYAREHGAELLVLGTRGRKGRVRSQKAGIVEKVLRLTTTPVLTVTPWVWTPPGHVRRIAVSVDFTEAARAAYRSAAAWGRTFSAEVALVHPVDSSQPRSSTTRPRGPYGGWRRGPEGAASWTLEAYLGAEASATGEVQYHGVEDGSALQFLHCAEGLASYLIVQGGVGAAGEPPEARVLEVIRRAACPVLTVMTRPHTPRKASRKRANAVR